MDYAESMADERGGNRIIEAYLKMKNPYTVKLSPKQFTDNIAEAPSIRYAKEHGHDGVIFEYDGSKEDLDYDKFYVVFDSAQIKSATDNIGTFDKTNPDIRYSSQDGRYRDLMGEKAVKYTKGILCAYQHIVGSCQRIDGQHTQRRHTVQKNVIIILFDCIQVLPENGFPAHGIDQRNLQT